MSSHASQRAHARVKHPLQSLPEKKNALARHNDRVLDWLADHVLASMLMFDIALIVPLIAIPMSDSVKITLGVISGSWIQWWALPALQREADKGEQHDPDRDISGMIGQQGLEHGCKFPVKTLGEPLLECLVPDVFRRREWGIKRVRGSVFAAPRMRRQENQ